MPDFSLFDYYLVLDLEATCTDREEFTRQEMEIIEIGAVMVEAENLTTVSEFQTFVKPVRHPILTDFCKSLTTITQEQVDQAPGYLEAIALLKSWLSKYPNSLFGSWGDFDRRQFRQDSEFHKVSPPIAFQHVNLKKAFTKTQKLPKKHGMNEALKLTKIAPEGTHHRGIDDARNIAKLLPYIVGRKQVEIF